MTYVPRLLTLLAMGAPILACGDNISPPTTTPPDEQPDAGPSDAVGCPTAIDPARLEQATWDPRFTIDGLTGHDGIAPTVYDLERDIDGSLVATGHFEWIGHEAVAPLARLTENGWVPARDTWELEPPGAGFSALAIRGDSALALATYDFFFNGRAGEIWFDDGGGLRVIGAFEGLVRKLEWYGGQLWVAGAFTIGEGKDAINNVAVWDGTTWSAPPGGQADSFAYELAVDGDQLLVGGAFSSIGGIATRRVAAFDGATWTALDLDLEPATAVYALTRGADGLLYAGGSIGDIESGHGAIARREGKTWSLVGGGVAQSRLTGVVTDLVTVGSDVYATGCFSGLGGPPDQKGAIRSRSVGRWDGNAWHAVDDDTRPEFAPWFQPSVCGDEGAFAIWDATHQVLAADGDGVVVGGSFAGAGGVLSQSVIAVHGGAWQPQGGGELGLGGSADLVEAGGPDCSLYASGLISHAGGEPASTGILHFDGDRWSALAPPLAQGAYCPALEVGDDGVPLLGCLAAPEGGGALRRAVGGEWQSVTAADDFTAVFTMTFSPDGTLWIGGVTATGGGYVARLAGDAIEWLEDGFDQPVYHIDVNESDVVVAGEFTQVAGVPALRVARFDGTLWSPLGKGLPSFVTAMARDGDRVYVSTLDAGKGGYLFGVFDGDAWTELASPATGLTPQSFYSFNKLLPVGDLIIAVGTADLDEGGERGALLWDGERFRSLAGGVRGISISDVALGRGTVWVGGVVAEAGAPDALVPSVGLAGLRLP